MRLVSMLALSLSIVPLSAWAHERPIVPQVTSPPPAGVDTLPPLPAPRFIAPSDINLGRVLPPFPLIGGVADRADIETILALQIRRTKVDEDDAAADSTTNMVDFTQKLLGSTYSPLNYPKLFNMMAALHDDMRGINRAANAAQGFRQRPAVRDARIRPSLNMIGHSTASYPSARTSSAGVWACVIGDLIPAQRALAQGEAERVAWRRVAGGVHYPSDLAGSRFVIAAVCDALTKSPAFVSARADVAAELAIKR